MAAAERGSETNREREFQVGETDQPQDPQSVTRRGDAGSSEQFYTGVPGVGCVAPQQGALDQLLLALVKRMPPS
jgi:hypothetical protein